MLLFGDLVLGRFARTADRPYGNSNPNITLPMSTQIHFYLSPYVRYAPAVINPLVYPGTGIADCRDRADAQLDVRQLRHSLGHFSLMSQIKSSPHAPCFVPYTVLSAYAYGMLIGACNPMVWPIHMTNSHTLGPPGRRRQQCRARRCARRHQF